jgi:hypothetical protein
MISAPRRSFFSPLNVASKTHRFSLDLFLSVPTVLPQTKWVVKAEKVRNICDFFNGLHSLTFLRLAGGKVKPLKAAKKDKKELDEEDLAHQAKIKAGMSPFHFTTSDSVY